MVDNKSENKLTTCPQCGSANIIKKGRRINKLKEVYLFFCKDCKKRFSFQKFGIKTYPIRTIVKALSPYNRGHTINNAFEKADIPRSTLSNWCVFMLKRTPNPVSTNCRYQPNCLNIPFNN